MPWKNKEAVLEEKEQEIHKIVGQEASGGQYNVIRLDQNGKPHNPMASAGGLLLGKVPKTIQLPKFYLIHFLKKISEEYHFFIKSDTRKST